MEFSYGIGMNAGDDEEVLNPLANRPAGEPGMHAVLRRQKELTILIEDVQQLSLGQIALISGGKGGFVQVHALTLSQPLVQTAARFIANAPKFTPLPPPTQQPRPKKKKIAAPIAGQSKKQAQSVPGMGNNPGSAAPISSSQGIGSGKPSFPQSPNSPGGVPPRYLTRYPTPPGGFSQAQSAPPSQVTPPPSGSAGQAGGTSATGEDDEIDFYS
jgi:hypothetical protein